MKSLSIQLWKYNPILQHILISLLLESNPPPRHLSAGCFQAPTW